MVSHDIICKVLSFLTNHRWGKPIPKEVIVNRSPVRSHEQGKAKEAVEELRSDAPFIEDHGDQGICLNPSEFYTLVEYLYHECGWEPEEIEDRIHHYEGMGDHEWYKDDL